MLPGSVGDECDVEVLARDGSEPVVRARDACDGRVDARAAGMDAASSTDTIVQWSRLPTSSYLCLSQLTASATTLPDAGSNLRRALRREPDRLDPRIAREATVMTTTRIARLSLGGLIVGLASAGGLRAQSSSASIAQLGAPVDGSSGAAPSAGKPTIVLVHGAFADATGWQKVIPILQRDGYTVIAVQNPLASLAGDVATTKRVIDAQRGPVVVVGHSYGGAVITGAAAGNGNVKALVYVAAFAPEAGEPIGAYLEKYPSALGPALTAPDAAGFLYIDPAKFRDVFARDVSAADARVMAAAQKPISGAAFGASVETPAWKTVPSWYVVAQEDRAINPDLERFYAKRMGAKTTEIKASHVVFVTHPKEVVRVIEQAAISTASTAAR